MIRMDTGGLRTEGGSGIGTMIHSEGAMGDGQALSIAVCAAAQASHVDLLELQPPPTHSSWYHLCGPVGASNGQVCMIT